jgi:hypothetical protein
MHLSLGQWPKSIGYGGFDNTLILHAKVGMWSFTFLVYLCMFFWPVATFVSAVFPKTRHFVPYLAVFAVAVLASYGLLHLAPDAFLKWWWD